MNFIALLYFYPGPVYGPIEIYTVQIIVIRPQLSEVVRVY
jgi:hypothetical protein